MSSLEAKIWTYNCDFRCGMIHVNVRKTHKEREEKARGNSERFETDSYIQEDVPPLSMDLGRKD